MRYTCVDTAEFLYPDITEYKSGTKEIKILSPRGSYACAQILFSDVKEQNLNVKADGWNPELYEMVPIYVERNHGLDENNSAPHMPERRAPYYLYDCIKPIADTLNVGENGVCALYLSA